MSGPKPFEIGAGGDDPRRSAPHVERNAEPIAAVLDADGRIVATTEPLAGRDGLGDLPAFLAVPGCPRGDKNSDV